MNKGKLCFVLATLLLVAYAVRPGSALCGPNLQSCGCVCVPGSDTIDYEGSGSTCSEASFSARSQAYAAVEADCWMDGYCSRSYNVETACYWDAAAGVYKEVGYAHYRCRTCE